MFTRIAAGFGAKSLKNWKKLFLILARKNADELRSWKKWDAWLSRCVSNWSVARALPQQEGWPRALADGGEGVGKDGAFGRIALKAGAPGELQRSIDGA
ncbi:hypothetical protein OIU34_26360 [Pararhizobium sp. BT-229]|uniref:hypothetical protein n=1 Tax=Pararhizobium sp. BT-229 TaxID=2986923 RepID=UPI0021F70822|nr:hypothetical protein [Pararhizobium sp. BT-229]MCV9965405.1 hypothetical protein [Pararhizobium sp. BT-229]